MSENIGSAITGLTTFNVNTLIPSLSDNADIQEALRLYHYGAPSGSGIGQYSLSNTNPANLKNPSIAHALYTLQSEIDSLVLGVPASLWTGKGALVTATSSGTTSTISVGANGTVLTANSANGNGLVWSVPEVTAAGSETLLNKTLIGPTVSSLALSDSSIIFEGSTADIYETTLTVVNPTADRTITLPNVDGTVITTGNLSSITSVGTLTSLAVTGNAVSHIALNTTPTGAYTVVLADDGKIVEIPAAGAVTIPSDATTNFPVGTQITILQTTSGQVTVVGATSPNAVTINATPGLKLRTQWSSCTVIKRNTNLWVALGDLTA
jgi:hypothetical protein